MTQATRRNIHEGFLAMGEQDQIRREAKAARKAAKAARRHRHAEPHRHLNRTARHYVKLSGLFLVAHFVFHFSFYGFNELWVERWGLPDPKYLASDMAGGTPILVVVAVLGFAAFIQALME